MNSILRKNTLGFLSMLFLASGLMAQDRYRIYFSHKNTTYDPCSYLDEKAVERRLLNGLNLMDSTDFPVNPRYIEQVSGMASAYLGCSRWFNSVFIEATEKQVDSIRKLSFVKNTELVPRMSGGIARAGFPETELPEVSETYLSENLKAHARAQTRRIGGHWFDSAGVDGSGLTIAILDVGFKGLSTHPAFRHIRNRNGIRATYDFVKKRENVETGMVHGSEVLSCLGGKAGSISLGLATGAEYLLARTEGFGLFIREEENWLMAAEWADKHGADIINSSLGYTYQHYLPEDMDGHTALISKAAQMASEKGILVVCPAGNEGESSWKRITAPGDAKDVLTVGGIDPETGIHIGFSSYGPSWDRRLKPELCAYGEAVVAGNSGYQVAEGTSFASPLVAGFAACMKQIYPKLTNMELKDLICRAGDLWPYYDYVHGYGAPVPYFINSGNTEPEPPLVIDEDSASIRLYPTKADQRSSAPDTVYQTDKYNTAIPPLMFYHIKNQKGYLDKYFVLDFRDEENDSITISKTLYDTPYSVSFYYKGFSREIMIHP